LKLAMLAAFAVITLAIVTGTGWAQDSKTPSANRELLNATVNGDVATVRILLDNGANVETNDAGGSALLALAAEHNNIAMVKLLLEKGADPSAKDQQDETALISAVKSAAWSGSTEIVKLLLEKTTDVGEKEQALSAVLSGPGSVVTRSISGDANEVAAKETADSRLKYSDSPAVKTVEFLLDNGVPIEFHDEDGSTPLSTASAYGETDIVRLLLKRGADFRARDKYGNTALMAASCQCARSTMNDTYDIVKILLEKGADANTRNREGKTALMLASGMAGDSAVLKLLLDGGADPGLKDKHGETALAFATKSYRQDKVEVLKHAVSRTR
jgi:uncharacterized protein